MYRFRLSSDQVQLELVGNGSASRLPFQVVGPITEVAFLEELITDQFGGLTANPRQLFQFLTDDPWVRQFFKSPQLIEGDLNTEPGISTSFSGRTLGEKLVTAGVLLPEELDRLLDDYRPFASTQRFGEFLRLNLQIPAGILDLLLNPGQAGLEGFNEKRLGERLMEIGTITQAQLDEALSEQSRSRMRIGEVLASKGWISPVMARFFSLARVNEHGEIDYNPG